MKPILEENQTLPSNIKLVVHRANKRTKLLRWLYEVVVDFGYTPSTFILSTVIIDKYMKISEYQLLGITALFIAAKIEECDVKHVRDYADVTDNAFSIDEILNMEVDMMLYFNFDFNFVLPHNFLKENLEKDQFYLLFIVMCYVLEKELNMYHVLVTAKKIFGQMREEGVSKEMGFYFERNERAKAILKEFMK